MRLTQEQFITNKNEINFLNGDLEFEALNNLLQKYGREFILSEEHETIEQCVMSYTLRSKVMKFACDVCEHYCKAMLIESGMNWDDLKSIGHNLLNLFNSLDSHTKSLFIITMEPNYIELPQVNIENNDYKTYLDYLFRKYNLLTDAYKDIPTNIYSYDNSTFNLNIDDKEIPKIPIIIDPNIIPLPEDSSIEEELEKVSPKRTANQINIQARYPGSLFINGNAEFLISLAYAMNKIHKESQKFDSKLK